MKKTKWLMATAAVLAMSLAAGCGGGDKKAADTTKTASNAKGEVMVYTSIYPDIIDNMCKPNVAKAFPNMKVSWFQGGTEKVITKINGEIKADKIGADLLMVADPSFYLNLQDDKRLLNYVSPNLKD
ncbi:MAG: ABC transporter substrate-binding protein, partial [Acidaminococcaceae bacterium]